MGAHAIPVEQSSIKAIAPPPRSPGSTLALRISLPSITASQTRLDPRDSLVHPRVAAMAAISRGHRLWEALDSVAMLGRLCVLARLVSTGAGRLHSLADPQSTRSSRSKTTRGAPPPPFHARAC